MKRDLNDNICRHVTCKTCLEQGLRQFIAFQETDTCLIDSFLPNFIALVLIIEQNEYDDLIKSLGMGARDLLNQHADFVKEVLEENEKTK